MVDEQDEELEGEEEAAGAEDVVEHTVVLANGTKYRRCADLAIGVDEDRGNSPTLKFRVVKDAGSADVQQEVAVSFVKRVSPPFAAFTAAQNGEVPAAAPAAAVTRTTGGKSSLPAKKDRAKAGAKKKK